jgi:hypothetical protein
MDPKNDTCHSQNQRKRHLKKKQERNAEKRLVKFDADVMGLC